MANIANAEIIQTANTFDHWRIRDNLSANDVNEIARGNFTKTSGNVEITTGYLLLSKTSGVSLTVDTDARVSGNISVKNFTQDAAANFASDAINVAFRNVSGNVYANGNTWTRFLYNNTFISAANINATGYIETTGLGSNNANLIMNVGGILTVRTAANSSNVAILGNLSVSNVATIGNARITLANVTTLNTSTVVISTANVATLNVKAVGATANIANANIANLATGNVIATAAQATNLNVTTGNITTLSVTTLTVTDPISAPSESASDIYRLRVGLSPRGIGTFGVFQGTSNGNAAIRFNTTGNVWQSTANDLTTFATVLNTANIGSAYSADTANVASLTLVKGANDNALAAFASSNNAANTVRVSQNTGSTIVAANGVNFNNTATITVSVGAGVNGNANVSFAVVGGTAQGATGAQGTAGSIGTNGSQGTTGTSGSQGATGSNGSNGAQGTTGAGTQGTTGTSGAQGASGSNGSNGSQGTTGGTGSTGSQGTSGSNGSNGSQGTTGTTGGTGGTGSQGTTGTTGATGPSTLINATAYSSGTYYPVMVASSGSNYTPYIATTFYFASGTAYATDFAATSDIRLKNVTGFIDNASEIVAQLNGIRYTWNNLADTLGYEHSPQHTSEVGVVAQEVQAVLPEAVYTDELGYLRVSYDRLVPVLIEAVKELSARIKVLEEK